MTIDLVKYIEQAKRLRPHTKRFYTSAVERWLAFAGPDPKGWTPVKAQEFYDNLIASGLAIATVNNMVLGGLTYAFKRANDLHGTPNIVATIDRYKSAGVETPRRALTAAQAAAILATPKRPSLADLRDEVAMRIGLFTGMRRMSLVGINLDQVFDRGNFVALRVPIKGGGTHDVPLDKRAWDATGTYRVALVRARGHAHGPLFVALRPKIAPGEYHIGDRLTEDGMYRSLCERARAAKVTKFSPHILRHTFITRCRDKPYEIGTQFLSAITGHAEGDSSMISSVYTDKAALAETAARTCFEALTDWMSRVE